MKRQKFFRGLDFAHTFAVLQNLDAVAEIQVYAASTGSPLLELTDVQSFPVHGYGDLRQKTKRMELNFAANLRMLTSGWNQGLLV